MAIALFRLWPDSPPWFTIGLTSAAVTTLTAFAVAFTAPAHKAALAQVVPVLAIFVGSLTFVDEVLRTNADLAFWGAGVLGCLVAAVTYAAVSRTSLALVWQAIRWVATPLLVLGVPYWSFQYLLFILFVEGSPKLLLAAIAAGAAVLGVVNPMVAAAMAPSFKRLVAYLTVGCTVLSSATLGYFDLQLSSLAVAQFIGCLVGSTGYVLASTRAARRSRRGLD